MLTFSHKETESNMKKMKMVLFLVSIFVLTFVFYSCSTDDDDDEALSISERIIRFCDDYNNKRNSIKNNFAAGTSLANSDMAYWNTFFGGSASNHQAITYSITTQGSSSTVNIICARYSGGHPFTFVMLQDGDNWKISTILQ
jgi:hypothetical protein